MPSEHSSYSSEEDQNEAVFCRPRTERSLGKHLLRPAEERDPECAVSMIRDSCVPNVASRPQLPKSSTIQWAL